MEFKRERLYGRWETRMQVPAGDSRYHPVLILWPEAEDWPVGGEVDYAETLDWFPGGATSTRPSAMNVAWMRYYSL